MGKFSIAFIVGKYSGFLPVLVSLVIDGKSKTAYCMSLFCFGLKFLQGSCNSWHRHWWPPMMSFLGESLPHKDTGHHARTLLPYFLFKLAMNIRHYPCVNGFFCSSLDAESSGCYSLLFVVVFHLQLLFATWVQDGL